MQNHKTISFIEIVGAIISILFATILLLLQPSYSTTYFLPEKSNIFRPEFNQELFGKYLEDFRKDQILDLRASKVRALLERYNSPMIGYERIIVEQADRCGGDYRLLTAIAGNESGFGNVPYRLYNPYGYLNNVTYSGWEEALTFLSCKISEQHLAPCNNEVACVITRYGGPDTDTDLWIRNINWFISQV